MKKWIISLLLISCLLMGLSATAFAADFGGTVTFDGTKINSSYTSAAINDAVGALQPGDDITISIAMVNSYTKDVDFWLSNRVVTSLEDSSSASGGAYTYRLTYTSPAGVTTTYYNSDAVGGESTTINSGLRQATTALQNYFYVDTLSKGQTGTITLYVALDGETQGNSYQSAAADLRLSFAAELNEDSGIVKTGDETQIMPYITAAAVSGVLLLVIACIRLSNYSKKRRGGSVK